MGVVLRAGVPPEIRLSLRLGVGVREYRELVEGDAWPDYATWERIAEFSGVAVRVHEREVGIMARSIGDRATQISL